MNVLVVDVAAEVSGAVMVLNQYYNDLDQINENQYYFCLSKLRYQDTDNIKVLNFEWVKKSWFHRLWFDFITVNKLVKKYDIDEVLSLQNTVISVSSKIPQDVFLHQSLPFAEYKFSILESRILWIYQNVISRFIISSVKKARKVIVQTKWMKNAVIDKCNVSAEKVVVQSPIININVKKHFDLASLKDEVLFFYPANGQKYKNHLTILKAVEKLIDSGIVNFKIGFTLSENVWSPGSQEYQIYEKIKKHVNMFGNLSHDQVMNLYSKSVLIFASYIETFGMPMLEARIVGAPVIASNCSFSHEILGEYKNADFFDAFNDNELFEIMKKYLKRSFTNENTGSVHCP